MWPAHTSQTAKPAVGTVGACGETKRESRVKHYHSQLISLQNLLEHKMAKKNKNEADL